MTAERFGNEWFCLGNGRCMVCMVQFSVRMERFLLRTECFKMENEKFGFEIKHSGPQQQ